MITVQRAESPSGMDFAPMEWTSYSIGQGFHPSTMLPTYGAGGVNIGHRVKSIGHRA